MGSTMDCSSLEAAFICIRGSRSGRAVCSCALPVAHAGCESIPYADDRQTRLSYPSCPVALRPPPPAQTLRGRTGMRPEERGIDPIRRETVARQ
jgi:hypothetical protein